MVIHYDSDDIARLCDDDRAAKKALGTACQKKLRRRLDDLAAAATLQHMARVPGNCHALKRDLAGQFAIDLGDGKRLLFAPAHDPTPCRDDGQPDWTRITAIRVIDVRDYHD